MIGFPFDSQVTYESNGTPVYDRAISSLPLKKLIKQLFTTGILPNPSTNLQVQAGTGMTVVVNPGFAVIEGGLKYEESKRTLAVQASSAMYDRIDTVVMRWNDNTNSRSCDLYVVQGIPASSPVRPELNRASSVYEIGLADIFIPANSSAISVARITDTRHEKARCGIISSVSEFDSDTIYDQIMADLAEFKTEEQAEFMAWFEAMKNQLSEDAAGNLQLQIDDLRTADTKDNTVSFVSGDTTTPNNFEDVDALTSGEKHSSLWNKVSLMFRNVRNLVKLMGTTDISDIGNGTVTGSISELNSNSEKNVKHLKSLIDGKLQFYQVKANNIDRIESSEFPSTYCIGMGALDDGTAVVSFHCSWIDIQIKANANNIYMRLHYGSNGWKGWKQIANFQ